MIPQSEIWSQSEGAAWLDRNRDKFPVKDDLVLALLRDTGVCHLLNNVLEVGCGNGWRLQELNKTYGFRCYGTDPCFPAISEARQLPLTPAGNFQYGTAERLMYPDEMFDLVIYGFCLYQVDRADLFRVTIEGHRVLAEGGHIVVYDFAPEYPHSVPYHHDPRLRTYKMDYAQLWLANPAYKLVRTVFDAGQETKAVLIRKDTAQGWPEEEKC